MQKKIWKPCIKPMITLTLIKFSGTHCRWDTSWLRLLYINLWDLWVLYLFSTTYHQKIILKMCLPPYRFAQTVGRSFKIFSRKKCFKGLFTLSISWKILWTKLWSWDQKFLQHYLDFQSPDQSFDIIKNNDRFLRNFWSLEKHNFWSPEIQSPNPQSVFLFVYIVS